MRFICAFYVIIVCDKPHIISAEDLKVKGLFALRRDPSECENCTGCHPEEQYKVKIRTAAARDELPDIRAAIKMSKIICMENDLFIRGHFFMQK